MVDPAEWVVRTKLLPPLPRVDAVARPRLLEALRTAGAAKRLTLVSAPAGYGKTTLLSAFAQSNSGMPTAWLSLDAEDDDPARFFAGLLAALRRVAPEFGGTTASLLRDLTDPGAEPRRVAGVLINDLVAGIDYPLALVIDDLHSIGAPAVYVALDYLLERLPHNIHLVVGTRHDPPLALARLRAHRELAELRVSDLRFTAAEAAWFFAGTPAGSLSSDQLTLVYERTDGWAAGMNLLAGALDHLPPGADRDAFLAHITASDAYVFDYLAEDVLQREDPATRDFLLRTSILTELTAVRAGMVTDCPDAGAVLDDLHRRNLFILALDAAKTTFRYHDLFRDFLRRSLRRELPPADLRELHRRAANAEPEAGRAIAHLLAIEAWDEAALAIERATTEALDQGTIGTLRDWIDALPEEARRRHPRLGYVLGVAAWDRWDIAHARDLLAEARDGFAASGDVAGVGEADVQLASCLIALGEHAAARRLLDGALAVQLPAKARVQLLLNRAWESLFAGDWRAANAALDGALETVEASDDPHALRMLAQQLQLDFVVLPGGPTRVERLRRLVESSLGDRPSLLRAYVATVVAWSQLWRGAWPDVPAAAEEALAINERFGGPEQSGLDVIGLTSGLLLARWHALRGDDAAADGLLDQRIRDSLRTALDSPAMRAWLTAHIYPLVRIRLLQGRTEEARALAARLPAAEAGEWTGAETLRSLLRGHLALVDRRLPEAGLAFHEAMEGQLRWPFTVAYGLAALPLAYVHLQSGRPEDALEVLAPVLADHKREGTPGAIMWEDPRLVVPPLRLAIERGIHADFAQEIVARLDGGSASAAGVAPPVGDEALTAREIDVLRLIAAGAGNAEIADTLFISVHTVKIHVARILAKLGVKSRGQAAARAHELGIV